MIEFLYDIKFIATVVITLIIYKVGKINQNLHHRFGVKGPKPWPYFGNLMQFYNIGRYKFDLICTRKYGKIYPFYFGGCPILVISDDVLLKSILIKDAKCFIDRFDHNFDKDTEKMLPNLKGKDWERIRNIISPTLTSGKLKKMSPLFRDCVELLQEQLKQLEKEPSLDIKEIFGALTMDVISRTMFGMEIDSQKNPNNKFIVNAKKLFSFSFFNIFVMITLLFPSVVPIMKKFKLSGFSPGTLQFFRTNIGKIVEERKKSDQIHNDFLASMLKEEDLNEEEGEEVTGKEEIITEDLPEKGTKRLSMEEILAQSLVFLLSGYDSIASTLTFTSYLLAKYPDIQNEVYEELISHILLPKEITYDNLMQLTLLDGAINETLRLYPPAGHLNRLCTQSIILTTSSGKKMHLKKGDKFNIPIYAIHHDPDLWPEPEKFDIHRFDKNNKMDRGQFAFMPFGMGPRNCVGMRFAVLELKWALASIMLKYKFTMCDETPETIEFTSHRMITPRKPIKLKMVYRN